MTSPFKPTKYRGTDVKLTPFVTRNRQPTGADYRQPETGRLYPIACIWQVGKNPTTGTEGDLFALSKIVANVAYWVQFSGGGIDAILSITVDDFTAPGTNPVFPDNNASVTVTGGQVAQGTIGNNVIKTDSLAANTFTIEIQQSGSSAAKDVTLNGVSHFNSTQFTVDEGFVSLAGGGIAVDQFLVQANTAPGVNPVTPDASGQVQINGNLVAAHAVPIETRSRALNAYNIEPQISSAQAVSTLSANGFSHYDSADFVVDASGFVSLNGTGNIVWQIISANQTLAINYGYICVSPGGNLALSLPATATLGDIIEITLDGSTGFTITQAVGQQIRYNNLETTLGAGGSIATTDQGNTIRMVAQTASRWNILSALGTLVVT